MSRRVAFALSVAVVVLIVWLGYRSVRAPTPGPLANDDVAESLGIQRRVGACVTKGRTMPDNRCNNPPDPGLDA